MMNRLVSCLVVAVAILAASGLLQPDAVMAGFNDPRPPPPPPSGAPAPLIGLGLAVGGMVVAAIVFVRRLGR
jgi:hypothetical protein